MIGDKQLLKDGTAKFSYTIPSGAVKGNILIRNEAGTLVYQGTADHTTGLHSFTWDGKDTQGVQQPDGVYTVQVSANDEKDVPLTVPLMTSGRVTGMEISDQGPILLVGSVKVPLDTVVKVKES
jgi:flagellar basal-body rod modification protein FlgD